MKLKPTILALMLISGRLFAAPLDQDRPLNVLFILIDDLRPELGCYGAPVHTPNIDKLSHDGVRFERAWAQFPLCNASRTSVLTGRYPTTTRVVSNIGYFRDEMTDLITLPEHFKLHGYTSVRVGKVYHEGLAGSMDDPQSWSIGADREVGTRPDYRRQPIERWKAWSDRIVVLPNDGNDHADHRSAAKTVEWLEKFASSGVRFFLTCGFQKPHTPLEAPQRYLDLYPTLEQELPADFALRPAATAGFPRASITANRDLFIDRDAGEAEAREMIRAYRASVSWIDSLTGMVLEALDRTGLRENTVVVLWGDHGFHLGEKGKWSKHRSLYDVALRVPLIISGPGIVSGQVSPRVVQSLDIYPTLVDLCGLPDPIGVEGRSLVPLLSDPKRSWPYPAFAVTDSDAGLHRAVRDDRWLYAEFIGNDGGAMLIDVENDPAESINLAEDPHYSDIRARLRAALDWIPTNVQPLAH